MIEAKGTRKDWEKFADNFLSYVAERGIVNTKETILKLVDKHGWITKPEWEQAYDEFIEAKILDMTPDKAKRAIGAMLSYIHKLEKEYKNGRC